MFIFRLFLILPLLLPAAALHAAVTTADGLEIVADRADASAGATVEALRKLDRQLANLFRFNARRSPVRCRIILSEQVPAGTLDIRIAGNERELSFNDRDGSWRNRFALRRRLIGALLAAKAGAPPPENPDYLPGWLVSGIDARLEASAGPELYLRQNRQLPVLRALLDAGKFPRFREQVMNDPDRFPAAARRWFNELARVMLDLAALRSSVADNALGDYVLLSARSDANPEQAFNATLGRIFLAAAETFPLPERNDPASWKAKSPDDRIQLALEYYARLLAWNEFSPRPAASVRSDFAAMRTFKAPLLRQDGKPGDGKEELRLEDLPRLLRTRSDHAALRTRVQNSLRAMDYGLSVEQRALLGRIFDAVRQLPGPEIPDPVPPPAAFTAALREFDAALDLDEKRERFLDEFERSSRSPFEFYRDRIDAAEIPDPMLTAPVREFIENTRRSYLAD